MKKFISIICLLFVLILATSIVVMAQQNYNDMNIEVVFDVNSKFTYEEKQIISNCFYGDTAYVNTYGLKCTLFGHEYTTEYVDVIRHKVSTLTPRCIKDTYKTQICADCSDTVSTLIATTKIDCCQ
jgi:hypothetical protein